MRRQWDNGLKRKLTKVRGSECEISALEEGT